MLTDRSFVLSDTTSLRFIRAWDRRHGQGVYVERQPLEKGTVHVRTARGLDDGYTALITDIDTRYFGENLDAGWDERRQAARRMAWDRREFWRGVARMSATQLKKEMQDHDEDMRAMSNNPDAKTHLRKVVANLQEKVKARRPLNPSSAAVRASDLAQMARRGASRHNREAERAWRERDIETHRRP